MRASLLVVFVLLAGSLAAAEVGIDFAHGDARVVYLEARRLHAVEQLARLLLSERKVAEARRLLEPEVERIKAGTPKGAASVAGVRLLYLMGIVEEMSGARARRDEYFSAARTRTPADEFTHLFLGKVFGRLHREDIAEAEFRKVLELEPQGSVHDVEALELLAQSAHANRRHKQAAELSDRLLKMLRKTRRLRVSEAALVYFECLGLVSRGFALLEEGKPGAWQRALEKAEKAWRLDPTRIEPPVLGERAAARCPDKARAKKLRAAWRKRSQHVASILRRSIAAEPREPNNYNALAWFLAELGRDHAEGIRAARRALELRPADPAYIDTLAELQFGKGDVHAAVNTIRRVTDLYPFANDYYRRQLDRFEAALSKPKVAGVP